MYGDEHRWADKSWGREVGWAIQGGEPYVVVVTEDGQIASLIDAYGPFIQSPLPTHPDYEIVSREPGKQRWRELPPLDQRPYTDGHNGPVWAGGVFDPKSKHGRAMWRDLEAGAGALWEEWSSHLKRGFGVELLRERPAA